MADVDGVIQDILNGETDFNSILSSSIFFKLASSINGLCSAMTSIECESFTSSTIWTSPKTEICWLIAIGIGGGGGGGGAAPILFSDGAVAGDMGDPGIAGTNTTFDGVPVGGVGAGGDPGELGSAGRFSHPRCNTALYTIKSNINITAGRGAYITQKAYQDQGSGDSAGSGGTLATYGMEIFKDLNPNTGYPIVIGQGGAGGDNHPILQGQLGPDRTLYDATNGGPGEIMIIYSGY